MRVAFALVPLLLVAFALSPGCTTTTTPAGTLEYNALSGNLTAVYNAPLDRAYAAAIAGINDLQFTKYEDRKDALQGLLAARTAAGNTIRVTCIRKSDAITEVTVGVGTFGKESTAQALMDKIAARLK